MSHCPTQTLFHPISLVSCQGGVNLPSRLPLRQRVLLLRKYSLSALVLRCCWRLAASHIGHSKNANLLSGMALRLQGSKVRRNALSLSQRHIGC